MNSIFCRLICIAFLVLPFSAANASQQSAEKFQQFVQHGKFSEGVTALTAIAAADANDIEARFAAGSLQFMAAISNLQTNLYRYGAGNELERQLNRRMRNVVPILRLPVPANPQPEVANYEIVRGIFSQFVGDLEKSVALLDEVAGRPVKLPFDPFKVAVDLNNDGTISDNETMLGALMAMSGGRPAEQLPDAAIHFDTADVTWLQGYANALMGIGNFFLAFDFQASYENSFHMIFGAEATSFGRELKKITPDMNKVRAIRAEIQTLKRQSRKIRISPEMSTKKRQLQRKLRKLLKSGSAADQQERQDIKGEIDAIELTEAQKTEKKALDDETASKTQRLRELGATQQGGFIEQIFDPLIFIHTINWQVVEPQRLLKVRQNYLEVMRLNRVTWKAAMAETDNDREWLPNANQDSPFDGVRMTKELITSWLKIIDEAEAVLNGEKLLPHLRFSKGINLRRFFEQARHFDLVMFLSGPNAVAYFETGKEVTSQRTWDALTRPFGRNFGLFMVWLN